MNITVSQLLIKQKEPADNSFWVFLFTRPWFQFAKHSLTMRPDKNVNQGSMALNQVEPSLIIIHELECLCQATADENLRIYCNKLSFSFKFYHQKTKRSPEDS
ncbi:hypothetical protein AMECASPLE_033898 [Ameca splendens]|uniref:Uncharacterized protein n=1 Tax=Ameca splendens TaxID=208324 RepID=A0ABV1A2C4_9TELE